MTEGSEAEEMPQMARVRPSWLKVVIRRLSVPLMLLLGLFVFFTAVGFDSLQQAAAADMPGQQIAPLQTALASPSQPSPAANANAAIEVAGTYLEFDEATAQRLSHSDLIGSHLTRSRLTSSHLLLRSTQ